MRIRASSLVPVAILVFAVIAVSAQHEKASQQAKENAQQSHCPALPAITINNQTNPAQQCDGRPDRPTGWHKFVTWPDSWTAWALIITFIAIAVQAGLMLRHSAHLETMANHIAASERPWILVKNIGNPPPGLIDPEHPHYNPGIGFQFQVYGNTPAEITECKFCIEIVKRKLAYPPAPDLPDPPEYRNPGVNPDMPALRVMRPPRDRFNILITLPQSPTSAQMEELLDWRSFLCAFGFIRYRDVFGGTGETAVCYVYDFANGGVLSTLDGVVLNPPGFRIGGPESYNRTT